MSKKKRWLTQEEIQLLLLELDNETFYIDSECKVNESDTSLFDINSVSPEEFNEI